MAETSSGGKELPTSLPIEAEERAQLVWARVVSAHRMLAQGTNPVAADELEATLRAGLWRYQLLWTELSYALGPGGYSRLRDLWWDSPRSCHARVPLLRAVADAARAVDEHTDARALLRRAIILQRAQATRVRSRIGRLRRSVPFRNPSNRTGTPTGTEAAAKALNRVTTALSECGIRGFLILETLQGYATGVGTGERPKLGVLAAETPSPELERAFADSEELVARWVGFGTDLLRVSHRDGATVDMYLHHLDDSAKRLYRADPVARWTFTPFELATVDFLGQKYYIPDNLQAHLGETFGDHPKPPRFDQYLDAPNVRIINQSRLTTAHYFQLLDAVIDGSRSRRLRYTTHLRSDGEGDWLARR